MDHDQRFKTLLKTFLDQFFRAFFPEWADRFDFPRVDWLEQEIFSDPPHGRRRAVNLVARLPLRPASRTLTPTRGRPRPPTPGSP